MALFPYFLGTDANERFDLAAVTFIIPVYIDGRGATTTSRRRP